MVSKLLHMNRMWEIQGLPPFCSNATIYRPGKNPNKLLFYSRTPFSLKIEIHHNSTREKYPNTELFLVCIQSEYRKIRNRNNFVLGLFSRSEPCEKRKLYDMQTGISAQKASRGVHFRLIIWKRSTEPPI